MINQKIEGINLLDCTFRDGGYYNNWDFDDLLIKKYLAEIGKSNIKNIEIGFRFFDQPYFLGSLAYTTDEFLKRLKIPKKINVCVMVNSGDLINKKNKKINELFCSKKKSRVNTVRFATHFREVKLIIPFLKEVNKLGYNVVVNLMQSNDRSEKEIRDAIECIEKVNCVSIIYFADSLGKMTPTEISVLVQIAKKYWKKDLGIHTHDNKGLALSNTIEAIKNGIKWVDSTILGMGRGAGNVQTEMLLAEFETLKNKKYKLEPVYRLSEGPFAELKKKYSWGKSLSYYLAAKNNIHPTYIQTLENDARYSKKNIYEVINYLKKIDARSYNQEKLKYFINRNKHNFKGKWNANNWCRNKNVILIGPGQNVKKYKSDIENTIKLKKWIAVSVNINESINKKLISYYIASNENRIMVDINKYSKLKKPIIMPYNRVKNFFKNFKSKYIKDYGLKIEPKKIKLNNNFCTLPNSLVFGYAISLCLIGKCKNIYLVGFDGHEKGDFVQEEMLDLIKTFKKNFNFLKLISLTPTTYPIDKSSIYAKNL